MPRVFHLAVDFDEKGCSKMSVTRSLLRTNLDNIPPTYGLIFQGDEFEPEFSDGDVLVLDRTQDPKPGDTVAVWLRPEYVPEGRMQAAIYRVHLPLPPGISLPLDVAEDSQAMPVLLLCSPAFPEKISSIPVNRLLGVHRLAAVQAEG